MRDFRPSFRRYNAAKALGKERRVRTLLGQLQARMKTTGQTFGAWRKTLVDGTKAKVIFSKVIGGKPPLRIMELETPEEGAVSRIVEEPQWYVETGLLVNHGTGELDCNAYRQSTRYLPDVVEDAVSNYWAHPNKFGNLDFPFNDAPIGGLVLDPLANTGVSGESLGNGPSKVANCSNKTNLLDLGEGVLCSNPNDIFCADADEMRFRKQVMIKSPPSLFSGKLRLFWQALYGAKIRRYDSDLEALLLCPPLYFSGQWINYDAELGNTWGLFSGTDAYYLVEMGLGSELGTARFYKLIQEDSPELYANLQEWVVSHGGYANVTTGSNREILSSLEVYVFAECTSMELVQEVNFDPLVEGSPAAYGWHFTWNGEKASIVLVDRQPDDFTFIHNLLTLTITEVAGFFSVEAEVEDGPYTTKARNDRNMLWTPGIINHNYSHMFLYSCTGWHNDGTLNWSRAPLYCYYTVEDELIVVVNGYQYRASGLTVGSLTISLGCDSVSGGQVADSGFKKGNRLVTTSDSRFDVVRIHAHETNAVIGKLDSGNGTGTLWANACSWVGSWLSWEFAQYTPSSPSRPEREIQSTAECNICGPWTNASAWLACMGFDDPPTHKLLYNWSLVNCTGSFTDYNPDLDRQGWVYRGHRGPGEGNYLSGSAGGSGQVSVLIPFYDCAAAYLVSEQNMTLSSFTVGWATATGSTAWEYQPSNAQMYTCGGNYHILSSGGIVFPRRGSFQGQFGPGAQWSATGAGSTAYPVAVSMTDTTAIFVGRDGLGRLVVKKSEYSAAFSSAIAGTLLEGIGMGSIFVPSSIFGEEAIPSDETFRNDNLESWFDDFLDSYAPCLGLGYLESTGPEARQSAVYNLMRIYHAGVELWCESEGDPATPLFNVFNDNDDIPGFSNWMGWA